MPIEKKDHDSPVVDNSGSTSGFPEEIAGNYAVTNRLVIPWIAFFALLLAVIHFSMPYPFDDDTAYHFSVAKLMSQHGILYDFPWTTFSWQHGNYADKELIFHLIFMPFTGLDFVFAARVVGIILGTGIIATLYLILRSERVARAGLWALIPLASSVFVFRIALVRPHLISIILALVLVWALTNARLKTAGVCALLYPLSYVAFWQIPLLIFISSEAALLAAGERFRLKRLLLVSAGVAAGVLIHPNSLNLLRINWIHMTDILFTGAWGGRSPMEMGTEFLPYGIHEWLRFLAIAVCFAVVAAVLAWKNRCENRTALAFVFATLLFAILTLKSMRFLEYFVPFSVTSLALATRGTRRSLAPVLLLISLGYLLAFGTGPIRALVVPEPMPRFVARDVARQFDATIPKGEQVFTCNWDYTGNLMLVLPERKFIVAADPNLFLLKNPQLYKTWSHIAEIAPAQMVTTIRKDFRSRFVICENSLNYATLFETLARDPSVATLLIDKDWVLFDLGGGPLLIP